MGHPKRSQQQQQQQQQQSKKTPVRDGRRPPKQQQQQQQQSRHLGAVVGGPNHKPPPPNGPYVTNAATASSLSESSYYDGNPVKSGGHPGRKNTTAANGNNNNNNRQQHQSMHQTPNKSYVSSTSSGMNSHTPSQTSSTGSNSSSQQKLYYTSPRIELPDAKLFPSSPVKRNSLQSVDDRWQTMSEQAGSHRQDSSVLHVSRRHMTPEVLKAGVLPKVAIRIRELHLRLEQAEDMLPEWLDVIAHKFQNLEHLVLMRDDNDNDDDDEGGAASQATQPSRLRRLYILYRLPHLKSIDHVPVTKSERRLARPDDPNGQRIAAKDEWYPHPLGGGGGGGNKKNGKKSKDRRTSSSKQPPEYNDDDDDDDNPSKATEKFVVCDSEEGYELDLELADAIQRITAPSPSSGQRHGTSDDQRDYDEAYKNKGKHPTTPKRSSSNNNNKYNNNHSKHQQSKNDTPKSGKKSNSAANHKHNGNAGSRDDANLEYVECDSTVTSTYGYGHWSGACFAPFQVCTGGQRRKSKEAFVARSKQQHGKSSRIKKPSYHVEDIAQQVAEEGASPSSPPDYSQAPSQQPSKSHKYSSLVDETVQKREEKHRRKLFRDSAASHGASTLPSSRRSKKYSKLLGEINDDDDHSSNSEEDDDLPQPKSTRQPQPANKKVASQKQTAPLKSQPKAPANTQKPEFRPKKQSRETKKSIDESDAGTLVGVSIAVDKGANSGMSVATIPSVLQRQAAKLAKLESKNLAARRNLTGVTIDVPPQTPAEAQKEPINIPNGKLKKQQQQQEKLQETATQPQEPLNKTKKEKVAKPTNLPEDPKPPKENPKKPAKRKEVQQEKPTKLVVPAVALNSMQETEEGFETVETFDGPSDPEIVDMVLNKLGHPMETPPSIPAADNMGIQSEPDSGDLMMQKLMGIEADLRIPQLLTPQSQARAPTDSQQGRRPPAGEASVASSEARSTKIFNKVKAKQNKKKENRQQRQEKEAAVEEIQYSHDTTDSSGRSKKNFSELESRLNSLINNTGKVPSSLRQSTMPLSPVKSVKSAQLSEQDQKIMEDTVSKLDKNLKNILDLQSSPTNNQRRSQHTRVQREKQHSSPERQRDPVKSSGATDASPLEKLENTMAGLFATIMGQMSPPRRALTSPANASRAGKAKKEKKRDTFFSAETEKTLDRLAADKSKDDDSTLFVVEIHNKDVTESLTHDCHFQPGKDKIRTEAPSVINLIDESIQSSVTNFASRNHTHQALALSPTSAVLLADEVKQKGKQGSDPSVIDLTDKTTNGEEVVNLIDVTSQQGGPDSKGIDTGGNPTSPGINHQGSKLGMVVNLPPINENGSIDVDGNCVAAAAAGAAAGAEAHGDNTCAPTVMESNYPSEYMPNTVASDRMAVDCSLPKEIVTGPPDANPIVSEILIPPSDEAYQTEFVAHGDGESEQSAKEPALIVDMLTARPTESNLSFLARRDRQESNGRIPMEVVAPGYEQQEENARRDSPPAAKEGGPTLPREILALLEEREGINLANSEEAMALLPSEIVMRIQHSFMSEDCYDPPEVPHVPSSGPPREIASPAPVPLPSPVLPHQENPSSMLDQIRAMLDEYDRKSKGLAPATGAESNNAACPEGNPLSLPSQVMPMSNVQPGDNDHGYEEEPATTIYAGPADEVGQQQWHHDVSRAQAPTNYGSSSGDSAVAGEYTSHGAQAHPPAPTVNNQRKPMGTGPFSRTSPVAARFRRNAGIIGNSTEQEATSYSPSLPSNVMVNANGNGNLPAAPTMRSLASGQDGSLLPHMGSLPSNVVVQQDQTTQAQAQRAIPRKPFLPPPSKSLTSPFPMQFRQPIVADRMELAGNFSSTQDLGASSVTIQNSLQDSKPPSLRLIPAQITMDTLQETDNLHTKPPISPRKQSMNATNGAGARPSSPAAKAFKKPVASPLLQSRARKTAARNLPPHNPASTRRPVSSISPRSEKMTKAMSRWKAKRSARSNSILDDDEFEDEDDANEEGEAGIDTGVVSYSE